MAQRELFELENLFLRLDKNKDPLVELNKIVDWKIFDAPLKKFFDAIPHKSDAGRKVIFQPLMMFKVLLLQSLHNLSDFQMEHQLRDRLMKKLSDRHKRLRRLVVCLSRSCAS